MSVEKRAGQFVGGVLSNPTVIIGLVLAVIALIIYMRIKNKQKRDAKKKAKEMEQIVIQQNANKKTLYEELSKLHNTSEQNIALFDDVGYKVALAVKGQWYLNDDEEQVITQFNRLKTLTGVKVSDFFYKRYQTGIKNPNIAYDGLHTLNRAEFFRVNADIRKILEDYARNTKGSPRSDVYF